MTIETSTDMLETMRWLFGSPQPCWHGPVSVTVQEGPAQSKAHPLSGLRFHLVNGDDGILTTTVGPFSKPLLTVSFLAAPGLTTPTSTSSISPLFYTWSGEGNARYAFSPGAKHTFHATTDPSGSVLSWDVLDRG
jgi:hypothetical protein